ncbi:MULTISPECIES: hypothetical protein [Sorangium]|uniref:Secreted protein n=1 Tax=Sorangium cellulosum TaxID=56 RepID=A0A4P2QIZ1_SORCE|nr:MULTISPECIES: hypothetical protein [Sorangium]AUX29924.1 uncharacterized protein SOCE836_020180 [Sorangium cellulosum]WCQ89312.1 hypothetical protein NQZ70_01999 [Sorangium sp. Soce836]
MKSIKSRVLSGVGAALVALSLSTSALASWDAPAASDAPNYTNVAAGLVSVAAQLTDVLDLNDEVINAEHIKIVYLDDVLNDADIDILSQTLNNLILNLQILNLQNVLKDVDVLNGIKVGDVLSNNDVDVSDVVGVKVFDINGVKKLLVFVK